MGHGTMKTQAVGLTLGAAAGSDILNPDGCGLFPSLAGRDDFRSRGRAGAANRAAAFHQVPISFRSNAMTEKSSKQEAPAAPANAQESQQIRLELDDSDVDALYANLCRVSSTPEEVILDLALNPNPMGAPVQKVKVTQRVILNHYTAKRLTALLSSTLQRHEQNFGRIETDVRKRIVAEG